MEITTNMIIASVVNLALFFLILFLAARKPVATGLAERATKTAELLQDAERRMAEMTAALDKQKAELGAIQAQIDEIVRKGETLSATLSADVLAGARAEGEQMRAQVAREVDRELQLAGQAVAEARKLLALQLDADRQAQLIRDFGARLQHAERGNGHSGGNA